MLDTDPSNRLSQESSPYLLQHAANPVDWYPWGPEALAKARRENKPILLSIGYSACHWCHVMAHESFADEDTARVLNELFVNIKVDREERPDLDKIYQSAHQLLNGRSGGWPLTMVLTPDDQAPFFGATYIAKESRHGLPSFVDLMQRLADYFQRHEGEVRQQNDGLMKALKSDPSRHGKTGYSVNTRPLEEVCQQLSKHFDADHGGFGTAPKFPQPTVIERLLRHWHHTEQTGVADKKAGLIAKFTLEKMANGGIYDHLGGGFYRYAVDQEWMIPHFEKMLYDNAQLLALYSQAWRATEVPLFEQVVEQTAAWALREMQSPEGGFYSSLDADTEGEEGKYYLWTPEQVQEVLSSEEYAVLAPRFGLDRPANFESKWHLHGFETVNQAAKQAGIDPMRAASLLAEARQKLLAARQRRLRPGRDDKILTAWNGLMIKGMAAAGRHLDRADWVAAAERALDFIQAKLWRDGRLLGVYKDGHARFPAYLDDHAFLLDGILELLQCRWRDGDLNFALALAEVLLSRFQDPSKKGGFYFTADDHETLIQRPKPVHDEALPAGGGITAQVLIKLGHLTNSIRHLVAAERALKNAWPAIERNPAGCNAMLLALEEYYFPSQTVIIRGATAEIESWRKRCAQPYAPQRLTLAIPEDAADLPAYLATREPGDGVVAYVCSANKCSAPITRMDDLESELRLG